MPPPSKGLTLILSGCNERGHRINQRRRKHLKWSRVRKYSLPPPLMGLKTMFVTSQMIYGLPWSVRGTGVLHAGRCLAGELWFFGRNRLCGKETAKIGRVLYIATSYCSELLTVW